MSDQLETVVYQTEMQCEHCMEYFGIEFDDPSESFEATCPHCNAHYWELYV